MFVKQVSYWVIVISWHPHSNLQIYNLWHKEKKFWLTDGDIFVLSTCWSVSQAIFREPEGHFLTVLVWLLRLGLVMLCCSPGAKMWCQRLNLRPYACQACAPVYWTVFPALILVCAHTHAHRHILPCMIFTLYYAVSVIPSELPLKVKIDFGRKSYWILPMNME